MPKNKYDMVKDYYDRRLWSKQRVYNAVGKWITAEQYEEITGEPYEIDEPEEEGVKDNE